MVRVTELFEKLNLNGVVPNWSAISVMDVADFYAYKGYIWRLTGATGGANKISFVTPAYTAIDRIALSSVVFDGSVTVTLYEAGSAASSGSATTPLNANRNKTNSSLVTAKTGVTYADDGTVLEVWAANNFKSNDLDLFYLKPETQYIIKFSGATNYRIQWAEI